MYIPRFLSSGLYGRYVFFRNRSGISGVMGRERDTKFGVWARHNKEASPEHPKKREMSKSTRIQMVTMLQTLETDDGMRSGSFAMVAECFGVARSTVYAYGTGWCARVHTAILYHRNFSPTKTIAGHHLFIRRSLSARE